MSPRKCKLFKKSLVLMGLTMMIEDGMPKMKPLKSRIEAILKVKPPTTVKECRSFCGMVNYMVHLLTQFTREVDSYILHYKKRSTFLLGRRTTKIF